jgi:caffeoyl-CoA O-methyltransferase
MNLVEPQIARYAGDHTSTLDRDLARAAGATREQMPHPGMMGGLVEMRLLQAFALASEARRVLEVGTFTGVTALALARSLPHDGRVTTIEADPATAAIARAHLDADPAGAKVELIVGDAREVLAGLEAPFDLAWIDAWKPDYPRYFELVLPLLGPHGIMAFDNVLRDGRVLDPGNDTASFNDAVQADTRVQNALLTIGDGVLLVWRANGKPAASPAAAR